MIEKDEWHKTIFGKEFEVIVYPEISQHKGHISMLVNPNDTEEVKMVLRTMRDDTM